MLDEHDLEHKPGQIYSVTVSPLAHSIPTMVAGSPVTPFGLCMGGFAEQPSLTPAQQCPSLPSPTKPSSTSATVSPLTHSTSTTVTCYSVCLCVGASAAPTQSIPAMSKSPPLAQPNSTSDNVSLLTDLAAERAKKAAEKATQRAQRVTG